MLGVDRSILGVKVKIHCLYNSLYSRTAHGQMTTAQNATATTLCSKRNHQAIGLFIFFDVCDKNTTIAKRRRETWLSACILYDDASFAFYLNGPKYDASVIFDFDFSFGG
jgi:hypothetical protein